MQHIIARPRTVVRCQSNKYDIVLLNHQQDTTGIPLSSRVFIRIIFIRMGKNSLYTSIMRSIFRILGSYILCFHCQLENQANLLYFAYLLFIFLFFILCSCFFQRQNMFTIYFLQFFQKFQPQKYVFEEKKVLYCRSIPGECSMSFEENSFLRYE